MRMIIALTATTAALSAVAVPASAASRGAFDAITAGYQVDSGDYCIRSGWALASSQTRRLVRAGDCHDAAAWRARGVEFDTPVVTRTSQPTVTVAAR